MVSLLLDHAQLEIALTPLERALSFQRRNIRVQRSAIAKVQLTEDAWSWLRGTAHPGTHVPGTLAMGTWRSVAGDDFVILRRSRPSVVLDLEGEDQYQRLILTTRHGLGLVKALRLDLDAAADVAEFVATPRKRRKPAPSPGTAPVPVT